MAVLDDITNRLGSPEGHWAREWGHAAIRVSLSLLG